MTIYEVWELLQGLVVVWTSVLLIGIWFTAPHLLSRIGIGGWYLYWEPSIPVVLEGKKVKYFIYDQRLSKKGLAKGLTLAQKAKSHYVKYHLRKPSVAVLE